MSAPLSVRQNLRLFAAEADTDGTPAWTLFDPLANRYFRLEENFVELLAFVDQQTPEEIADRASQALGRAVSSDEVEELMQFLRINNLTVADKEQLDWYRRQASTMSSPGWFGRLAKSYLFFRIPLWHPDRFLSRTLPLVSWMGNGLFLAFLCMCALLGLYFASREFDVFLGTFVNFFSLSGMFAYFSALAVVKILHELGHAYVAKSFGCRVPVIGVAFLVGWPVLYTDTTDAWKLASRHQRLLIGVAGVAVEMGIACLSLLLWAMVTDGPLRSVLFLLTTTTWVLSVGVNFNPLMRFDGYYLLSDLLRVPNLEFRAFEMARWWLREKLFGLAETPSETIRPGLVVYAFCIWVYRFFLFLGIALVVFHFFFKALGILLFAVEIVYFIARPLLNELKYWWRLRAKLHWNAATRRSALLAALLVLLFVLPWQGSIKAPALLQASYFTLYSPAAGRLADIRVSTGQPVVAGERLAELEAPQLSHDISQVQRHYQELNWLRASMGFDPALRQQSLVVAAELQSQNQTLRGLLAKREQLQISAPATGRVVNVLPGLRQGDWVADGESLFAVRADNSTTIRAWVSEQQVGRLRSGMEAVFYPQEPAWGRRHAVIGDIDQIGIRELDNLYQSSLFGGDIAVRDDASRANIARDSLYMVSLMLNDDLPDPGQVVRGRVSIAAERESLLLAIWRRTLSLLQSESGF